MIAFVIWQMRGRNPLLPLAIVLDRNRGAAYSAVLIAAIGLFGVFLFVTYYLQTSMHYSPIRTGLAFLPMIGMLIIEAQLSTNLLLPRLGPKVLVPIGMTIAALGMLYLTRLDLHSSYPADVLPPLMILGLGMGTIMPPSIQTATLGVYPEYAGVASALVNTSQQVGGSIGTALLNTLAATAAADYIAAHLPPTATVAAEAAVHSYSVAYRWGAGIFAFGAVLTALLFRRRVPADPPNTPSGPTLTKDATVPAH
jgi:predicted MFS family arabinose efflux permease